ncbi:MAG TPA: FUSC family protein, partial [Burkholderiaceae bacterium]
AQAMADLHAAIAYLQQQQRAEWAQPLRSLQNLARNLATLDTQLAAASNPGALPPSADNALYDRQPQSLREAVARVRQQLTPTSGRFRHALRLALALSLGYGVMRWMHTDTSYGYWILLTTLFVCQQNYGSTLQRVGQRILGTLLGLVAGWALLGLFPSLLMQALFAVAAGVAFFATRSTRYTMGTACITLLVLMCFNQTGNGYDLILPRLLDTVIGSAIAALVVLLVLPDWQGRRLHLLAAQAVAASSGYLREIMAQYASGKRDDLAYRLARRNAHNADAALSGALQSMLQEPGLVRRKAGIGMRLLVHTHTLLSYVSTLGAHRQALKPQDAGDALIASSAVTVAAALDAVGQALRSQGRAPSAGTAMQALAEELEHVPTDMDEEHRMVQVQLAQICRQIEPLSRVVDELAQAAAVGAVEQGAIGL